MKTLNVLLSILLILPLSAYAQDFTTRVKEAYQSTDKTFDIDCSYSKNETFKLITPSTETQKSSQSISRSFVVENEHRSVSMTFTLSRSQGKLSYTVLLDKTHRSSGKLKKREFFLAAVSDRSFDDEFETSQIFCAVNFAAASPYTLTDGNYHFNVHPHTIYDWQSKLKTATETYLNNPNFKSLVLLETGNARGNLVDIESFLDGEVQKLPASELESELVKVPLSTPLIVSPAGNNRFKLEARKEISVTYSGGNHNYCIWNSTRQVLISLMNSKSEARVNFIYDTHAIVAQPKGMEGLNINFSRSEVEKSNLLADLLSKKDVQAGYHFSYLIFFRNLFAQEYSGMYRSFKVIYSAPGYNETFIMHGSGTRDLEVNFSYL